MSQLDITQTAILFLVCMAAIEFIKLAVRSFYKRTVETEYVTVNRCLQCREECSANRKGTDANLNDGIRKLGESIDILRGIVLVLAVKIGVDEQTLQNLAKRKP